MNFYSTLLRPLLFRMNPEQAHCWSVELCRLASALPMLRQGARACFSYEAEELQCNIAGIQFNNPIGMAAGWDKSGRALRMLDALGFGFTEIGSISSDASQGNPKPRLFRLPLDGAIIVNYGLPNDGVEIVARRLANCTSQIPIGVNIVKTNRGPLAPPCSSDEILEDYFRSFSSVHGLADYIALNLSCPNAADGKDFFAQPGNIERLLKQLATTGNRCPVFLKVAPVDDPAEHDRLLSEVDAFDFVRGFMFNLPAGRPDSLALRSPKATWQNVPGAVSGKPVEQLINRCIAGLAIRMNRQRHAIVGAGGVFSGEDAYRKIRLGASLVQIYTALVYEGPGIVKRIQRKLHQLLVRDGFQSVSQAVGIDVETFQR